MKKFIFWKFFAGFFAMSLFLALTFYFLTMGQVRSFYVKTYEEHLQKLGMILSAELTAVWPKMDADAMDQFIKTKGQQAQTRLTVIDRQGKVLADSQKDPLLMQNHSDRPEVAAALSGRTRSEIHFSFTLRENMLYFAMPLRVDGKNVAALRLSLFFKDIEHEFSPWRWKITAALMVLLCLSMLFSYLLSRNLARPIRGLAQAARQVASGNLDSHVQSRRRDEIGQLTADFNAMVDSQKDMVQKLQHSQQELETILASISDGLLVIDARERITRAGPRFCRLIGDPNPLGKLYWEVLRLNAFDELVKKTSAGQTVHTEIEINQRVFLVSFSPLPANGGTVVTFHDLSETRRLEKQKKDFVANVSHELRTPLTAIKGYAETLSEESSGDVRKYLDVILRHTDRLIGLTADLLTLSELEEKNLQSQLEPIDWPEMLARIRGLFETKIRENISPWISVYRRIWEIFISGEIPSAWSRCSSTCWTTRSNTLKKAASPSASQLPPTACSSKSETAVSASHPNTCPASSSGFMWPTRPARARPAAPAWAWPSSSISSGCTAARSQCRVCRGRALFSPLISPCFHDKTSLAKGQEM